MKSAAAQKSKNPWFPARSVICFVARLLKRHLISRDRDEQDKRRSRLQLSETGLTVYDEVMPIARNYEARLLSNLTGEELKIFNGIIDKLTDEATRFEY